MILADFSDLVRILVVGPLAYLALVLLLRLTGKRMLSKMNAFDFVVTIALGSTLATVLLSKEVALAEGVLALAVLIGLQYVIAWGSSRSKRFNSLVQSEPQLLFYRGRYLDDALRAEHVSEGAVRSGIRDSGYDSTDDVEAVVLEADGTLSVLGSRGSSANLLDHVRGAAEARQT